MTDAILLRWDMFRYDLTKWHERVAWWIADRVPRRVRYFVVIGAWVKATGDQEPTGTLAEQLAKVEDWRPQGW